LLEPWQSLLNVEFATAEAFRMAFGWTWLVQLIMFGVVLSLLKVFNGNFLAATRLLYAMGSREMLGGPLGHIHPKFRTPTPAILLVGTIAFLATMLGQAILRPITEVGSFTCVLGWLATCLSYCLGAAGPLKWLERAVGFLGAGAAATFAVISAWGFGKW